ncbi:MAG: hypothetical protein ACUVRK_07905 [Spirochaetota bacterium]
MNPKTAKESTIIYFTFTLQDEKGKSKRILPLLFESEDEKR